MQSSLWLSYQKWGHCRFSVIAPSSVPRATLLPPPLSPSSIPSLASTFRSRLPFLEIIDQYLSRLPRIAATVTRPVSELGNWWHGIFWRWALICVSFGTNDAVSLMCLPLVVFYCFSHPPFVVFYAFITHCLSAICLVLHASLSYLVYLFNFTWFVFRRVNVIIHILAASTVLIPDTPPLTLDFDFDFCFVLKERIFILRETIQNGISRSSWNREKR